MTYLFLTYFGYFLLIINFVLYAKGFSKFGGAFKTYTSYLFLLVIVQMAMEIMTLLNILNLYLVHCYFIGQFILLGIFYRTLLQDSLQKKVVVIAMSIGLLVLVIQYGIEPDLFFKFNLLEIAITSLLVVFFALMYLYNMLTTEKKYYYITIGLVIYLLASTVLFLVGNLTLGLSDELKLMTWTLNAFFVVVNQLFILYEWKVSFRNKKEIPEEI
ncbi:hypothetical protein [uncultured Flavobacterium sp.]|uniref:hypothetical protein n=1 Tax=uncultured Flavobacterium sp. TaxID=165435 RepID=UPI0029304D9A|nr:hypothetical protein [uncultured Flavobacterium sp.]